MRQNQQGIVSILIAVVFIVVTLLIVTGFAQIARRDSRIALDRQLSSQALYAAESGVNDAIKKLQGGGTLVEQTQCLGSGSGSYTVNGGIINTADRVSYTCQLVSLAPSELSYDSVDDKSIIIPVEVTSGSIGSLNVNWQKRSGAPSAATGASCMTGTSFGGAAGNWPAVSAWPANCHYGVMRIDILPATATALQSADAAAAATATAFVVPGDGSTANFNYTAGSNRYAGGTAAQGHVLRTGCNASSCTLRVNGLSFQKAYFRISFLYRTTQNLQVAGVSGGATTTFQNAQAVVDVTGKAQDVLRRIQVRIPITGVRSSVANSFPEYAIQSNEDICKRFFAAPVDVAQSGNNCGY